MENEIEIKTLPSAYKNVVELGKPLKVFKSQHVMSVVGFLGAIGMLVGFIVTMLLLKVASPAGIGPASLLVISALLMLAGSCVIVRKSLIHWTDSIVIYDEGIAFLLQRKLEVIRWAEIDTIVASKMTYKMGFQNYIYLKDGSIHTFTNAFSGHYLMFAFPKIQTAFNNWAKQKD